jgi:hypothetical protein
MGNWRTVNVVGTMSQGDADGLRRVLERGDDPFYRYWGKPFACLSFCSARPGLAGLGDWPAAEVSRCGNLAERDYSVEDVAEALRDLVRLAPSMLLLVHCGGDWESDVCVATIHVGEGLVAIGTPMVEKVIGPSESQMLGNLATNLLRG